MFAEPCDCGMAWSVQAESSERPLAGLLLQELWNCVVEGIVSVSVAPLSTLPPLGLCNPEPYNL